MKTAFVSPILSEVLAGYNVSTYIDDICIERRMFLNYQDAENFANEWMGTGESK
jgi:hypothetical protein